MLAHPEKNNVILATNQLLSVTSKPLRIHSALLPLTHNKFLLNYAEPYWQAIRTDDARCAENTKNTNTAEELLGSKSGLFVYFFIFCSITGLDTVSDMIQWCWSRWVCTKLKQVGLYQPWRWRSHWRQGWASCGAPWSHTSSSCLAPGRPWRRGLRCHSCPCQVNLPLVSQSLTAVKRTREKRQLVNRRGRNQQLARTGRNLQLWTGQGEVDVCQWDRETERYQQEREKWQL